MALAKPTHLP